jgi:hypothetical protein
MSSLSPKDRVSSCMFSFADGRRCRTPRAAKNPRFCFYHAQKEARARNAQKLGKDLTYFFSGNYLSACDLSTALGRLIPAVIRGDVKPRTARTVAYMAQTLLQAIHLSKHEYINAFGYDAWRQSISNSVNSNHDYLFPPAPTSEQPAPAPEQSASPQPQPRPAQTPVNCHSKRSEGSEESAFSPSPAHPKPQPAPATQPAPPPHTPLPPTSAEFVQHVLAARLPRVLRSDPVGQAGGDQASQPSAAPSPQPAPIKSQPTPPAAGQDHTQSPAQTQQPVSASSPLCHPERSEGSQPIPTTQLAQPGAPASQPANPPPRLSPGPNRDAPWWHFGDSRNIPPDSHLL